MVAMRTYPAPLGKLLVERQSGLMTKTLEVFFDCSSPWTYLAFENLLRLQAELGFEIDWRPILVGGIFNAANPSVYQSREAPVPAKADYMKKDLTDWARLAGLKIVFPPSVFPVNSVKAMRGCIWLEPQGRLVDFARACFEAYWSEDRDISQDAVLADLCDRVGVNPDAFFAAIADPSVKEQLRLNTEEAMARGAFGSPTMFLGQDMYFGNDRLPLVRAALSA
jgi:2-hydroxychromene-2-carboxylate isomerase